MSDQLHAPAALPTGKAPRYSLNGMLGGCHSKSGGLGDEKDHLSLTQFEPQTAQPVVSRYSVIKRSVIVSV
jgi:hypothetical protein